MNIAPDENAVDLKLRDIPFHDHGSWKPETGVVYHYFSVIQKGYLLVSSIRGYGNEVHVFYDGGYSTLLIPDLYKHQDDMLFKKSPHPSASYSEYGMLLIDGKRLTP
jgi:hypothetical protein